MYTGKTVFSQVMDYVPMYEFRKCIDRYNGNYHTSSFSCITLIRWINPTACNAIRPSCWSRPNHWQVIPKNSAV